MIANFLKEHCIKTSILEDFLFLSFFFSFFCLVLLVHFNVYNIEFLFIYLSIILLHFLHPFSAYSLRIVFFFSSAHALFQDLSASSSFNNFFSTRLVDLSISGYFSPCSFWNIVLFTKKFFSHIFHFFLLDVGDIFFRKLGGHFGSFLLDLRFIFNKLLLLTFMSCNTSWNIKSSGHKASIYLSLLTIIMIYEYFLGWRLFSSVFAFIFMPTAVMYISLFRMFKFKSIAFTIFELFYLLSDDVFFRFSFFSYVLFCLVVLFGTWTSGI